MSKKRLKFFLMSVLALLIVAFTLVGCEISDPVKEATYYINDGELNKNYKDQSDTNSRVDEFTDSITALRTYLDGESFVDTGYYMGVNYDIDVLDEYNNTAGNFQLRVKAYLYTYPYEDEEGRPIYKYYENGKYYDENNEQGTRKLVNALEIHNEAIKKSDISIEWYNGATNTVLIGLYFDGLNSNSDNPGNILYVDIQGARRSFPEFGDTVLYQQMIRLIVNLSVEGLLESLGLQDDTGTGSISTYMKALIGDNSKRVVNGKIISLLFYSVTLDLIANQATNLLVRLFGVFGRKWDPLTYKYLGFRFSTVANATVKSMNVDMQDVISPDKEGLTNVLTDAVFDIRGTVLDQSDVPYSYTCHVTFDYGWTYPEDGSLDIANTDWYKEFVYGNYEFQGLLYVPAWDSQFDALIRTDMQPYDNEKNNVFIEFRDIANGELMIGIYYKNERSYLDITGLEYMYGWIDLNYLGFPQVYDEHLDLAYVLKKFFKTINNVIVSIVDSILDPSSTDKENSVLARIIAKTSITEKIEFSAEDRALYKERLINGQQALYSANDIKQLMLDEGYNTDVAKIISESSSQAVAKKALENLHIMDDIGINEALSWYEKIGLTATQYRAQLEKKGLPTSKINEEVNRVIEEALLRKDRESLLSANTETLTVDIELIKQMLEETGAGTFTTRQLINVVDSVLPYSLDQLAIMLGIPSAELMVEETYFTLTLDVDTNEMTMIMYTNLGVEEGEPSNMLWSLELTPVHFGERVTIADVDFSKFNPLGDIYTYSGTLSGNFIFSSAETVDLSKLLSATIAESSGLNTPYVLPNNVGVHMDLIYDQFVTDNYVNDDGETVQVGDPSGTWKLEGRSAFDLTMKIIGEDTIIIRLCSSDVCFNNDVYKMLDSADEKERSEAQDLMGYIWVSIECVRKNGQQAIPKVKIREDVFMASMTAYMNGETSIGDNVSSFADNDFNISLTSIISALCKDAYVVPEPKQLEITSSNDTLQSLFRVDGLIGNIQVDAGFTYRVKGLESIKKDYYLHQVGDFTDITGNSPYDTALHDIINTFFYSDFSETYVLRDSSDYTTEYDNYSETHRRNKTVVTEVDYHLFTESILLDDGTKIGAGTLILFELGAKKVVNRQEIVNNARSFFENEPEENQNIEEVRFLLTDLEGLVRKNDAGEYSYINFFGQEVTIDEEYISVDVTQTVSIKWKGLREVLFYNEGTEYYFFDMEKILRYIETDEEHNAKDSVYLYQTEYRKLLFEYDADSVEITAACKTQYSPRTNGSFMGETRRYYVTFSSTINGELGALHSVYYEGDENTFPPEYYTVAPAGDTTHLQDGLVKYTEGDYELVVNNTYDDVRNVKVFYDGKLNDWYYDPAVLFVLEPCEPLIGSTKFNVCTTENNIDTSVTEWTTDKETPHARSKWKSDQQQEFSFTFEIDWSTVTLDGLMVETNLIVAEGMMGETVFPCRIIVTNRRVDTTETASVYDRDEYTYRAVVTEDKIGDEIAENTYYVYNEADQTYSLTSDKRVMENITYYTKEYVPTTVPVVDSYDLDPYEYLLAKYEYLSNPDNFSTATLNTEEKFLTGYLKAEQEFIHEYFGKIIFDILFAWEKSNLYKQNVQQEYIAKTYTNRLNDKNELTHYDWEFDIYSGGSNVESLIRPSGGVVYAHTRFHGQLIALRINVGVREFAYVKFNTVDENGDIIEDTYSYADVLESQEKYGTVIHGRYVANYYDSTSYVIDTQPCFVFRDKNGLEYEYYNKGGDESKFIFNVAIVTGLNGTNYVTNDAYELVWSGNTANEQKTTITNVGTNGSYFPEYVYTALYTDSFYYPIKEISVSYEDSTGSVSLNDKQRLTYVGKAMYVENASGNKVLYTNLASSQRNTKVYLQGRAEQVYLYFADDDGYAMVYYPLYRNDSGTAQVLVPETYAESTSAFVTKIGENIPYESLSAEQKMQKVRVHVEEEISYLYLYVKGGDGNAYVRNVYDYTDKYTNYVVYSFLTMEKLEGYNIAKTQLTDSEVNDYLSYLVETTEGTTKNLYQFEGNILRILQGAVYSADTYLDWTLDDGVTKIPYKLLSDEQKEEEVEVSGTTVNGKLFRDNGGYAQIRAVVTYSPNYEMVTIYHFVSNASVDIDEEESSTPVVIFEEEDCTEGLLFREQDGNVQIRKADIYRKLEIEEVSILSSSLQQGTVNVGGVLVNKYDLSGTIAKTLKVEKYKSAFTDFKTIYGEKIKNELLTEKQLGTLVTVEGESAKGNLYQQGADGYARIRQESSYQNTYVEYIGYQFNDYYLPTEFRYSWLVGSEKNKVVTVYGEEEEQPLYISYGDDKVGIRLGYWYTDKEWENFSITYTERNGGVQTFGTLSSLITNLTYSVNPVVDVLVKDYRDSLFNVDGGQVYIRLAEHYSDDYGLLQINSNLVPYDNLSIEQKQKEYFINVDGYVGIALSEAYGETFEIFAIGATTYSDLTGNSMASQQVIVRPTGNEAPLYRLSEDGDGYAMQRKRYTGEVGDYFEEEYRRVNYGTGESYLFTRNELGELSLRSDSTELINRPFYYFTVQDNGKGSYGTQYAYTVVYDTNGVALLYGSLSDDEKTEVMEVTEGTMPVYISMSQANLCAGSSKYYAKNTNASDDTSALLKLTEVPFNTENANQISVATINFYYLLRLFAPVNTDENASGLPISVITGETIPSEVPGAASLTNYPSITARIVVECPRLEPSLLEDKKINDDFTGKEIVPSDVQAASYGDLFRINQDTGLLEIRVAKSYSSNNATNLLYLNSYPVDFADGLTATEKQNKYFTNSANGQVLLVIGTYYTEQWRVFSVGGRNFTSLAVLSKALQTKQVITGETVNGEYRLDPLKQSSFTLPDSVTVYFTGDSGVRRGHSFSGIEWHYSVDAQGNAQDKFVVGTQEYTVVKYNETTKKYYVPTEEEGGLPVSEPKKTQLMARIGDEKSGYTTITLILYILSKDPNEIYFYKNATDAETDNSQENDGKDRSLFNRQVERQDVQIVNGTKTLYTYYTFSVNTFNDAVLPKAIVAEFSTHYSTYEVRWKDRDTGDFNYALKPNTTVHLVSDIRSYEGGTTTEVDLVVYLDILVQNYAVTDITVRGEALEYYVRLDNGNVVSLSSVMHFDGNEFALYYLDEYTGEKHYIEISTLQDADAKKNEVARGKIGLFTLHKETSEPVLYDSVTVYSFLNLVYNRADIQIQRSDFTYFPYSEVWFYNEMSPTSGTYVSVKDHLVYENGKIVVKKYTSDINTYTFDLSEDADWYTSSVQVRKGATETTVNLIDLMAMVIAYGKYLQSEEVISTNKVTISSKDIKINDLEAILNVNDLIAYKEDDIGSVPVSLTYEKVTRGKYTVSLGTGKGSYDVDAVIVFHGGFYNASVVASQELEAYSDSGEAKYTGGYVLEKEVYFNLDGIKVLNTDGKYTSPVGTFSYGGSGRNFKNWTVDSLDGNGYFNDVLSVGDIITAIPSNAIYRTNRSGGVITVSTLTDEGFRVSIPFYLQNYEGVSQDFSSITSTTTFEIIQGTILVENIYQYESDNFLDKDKLPTQVTLSLPFTHIGSATTVEYRQLTIGNIVWEFDTSWINYYKNLDYMGTNGEEKIMATAKVLGAPYVENGTQKMIGQITLQLYIIIKSAEVEVLPWEDTTIKLSTETVQNGSSNSFYVYVDAYNDVDSSALISSDDGTAELILPTEFKVRFGRNESDLVDREVVLQDVSYLFNTSRVVRIRFNLEGIVSYTTSRQDSITKKTTETVVKWSTQRSITLEARLGFGQTIRITFYFYDKTQYLTEPIYSISDESMRNVVKSALGEQFDGYEQELIAVFNDKRAKYNLETLIGQAQEIYSTISADMLPTVASILDVNRTTTIKDLFYDKIYNITSVENFEETVLNFSYTTAWTEEEAYEYALYYMKATADALSTDTATNVDAILAKSSARSVKEKNIENEIASFKTNLSVQGYSNIIQSYMEREFSYLFEESFESMLSTPEVLSQSVSYKNSIEGKFDTERLLKNISRLNSLESQGLTDAVFCARQFDFTYCKLYGWFDPNSTSNDMNDVYKFLFVEEMYRTVFAVDLTYGLRNPTTGRFVSTADENLLQIRQTVINILLVRMGLVKNYPTYTVKEYEGNDLRDVYVLDSNGIFVSLYDLNNRQNNTDKYLYNTVGDYVLQTFVAGVPVTKVTVRKKTGSFTYYGCNNTGKDGYEIEGAYTGGSYVTTENSDFDGFCNLVRADGVTKKQKRVGINALVERIFDYAEDERWITYNNETREFGKIIPYLVKYNLTSIDKISTSVNTIRKNIINSVDCTSAIKALVKKAVNNFIQGYSNGIYTGLYAEKEYVSAVRLVRQLNCDLEEVYIQPSSGSYASYVAYYDMEQFVPTVNEDFIENELYELDADGYFFHTKDTSLNDTTRRKVYYVFTPKTTDKCYMIVGVQQSVSGVSTLRVFSGSAVPSIQADGSGYYEFGYSEGAGAYTMLPTSDLVFQSNKTYYYYGDAMKILASLPTTTAYRQSTERLYASDTFYYEFYPIQIYSNDTADGKGFVTVVGASISDCGKTIYEKTGETTYQITSDTTFAGSKKYYVQNGGEYYLVTFNSGVSSAVAIEGESLNQTYYLARTPIYTYDEVDLVGEEFDKKMPYYVLEETGRFVLQDITSFERGKEYYAQYKKAISFVGSESYYTYSEEGGFVLQSGITSFEANVEYYTSNVEYKPVTAGDFVSNKYYVSLVNGKYGQQEQVETYQAGLYTLSMGDPIDTRDTVDRNKTYYVLANKVDAEGKKVAGVADKITGYVPLGSISSFVEDGSITYYVRSDKYGYVYASSCDYYILGADGNFYLAEDEVFNVNHTYYVRQVLREQKHVGENEAYDYMAGYKLGEDVAYKPLTVTYAFTYVGLYKADSYYIYNTIPSSYVVTFDEENGGDAYVLTEDFKWQNNTITDSSDYQGDDASMYGTLLGSITGERQQLNLKAEVASNILSSEQLVVTNDAIEAGYVFLQTEYRNPLYNMEDIKYVTTKDAGQNILTGEWIVKMSTTNRDFVLTYTVRERTLNDVTEKLWRLDTLYAYAKDGGILYMIKNSYQATSGTVEKQAITVYNPFTFENDTDFPSYINISGNMTPIIWDTYTISPDGNVDAQAHTVTGRINNAKGQEISLEMYVASWEYQRMYRPSTVGDITFGTERFADMTALEFYFSLYTNYTAYDKYLLDFAVTVLEESKTGNMVKKRVYFGAFDDSGSIIDYGINTGNTFTRKLFYPYIDTAQVTYISRLLESETSDASVSAVQARKNYLLCWDESVMSVLMGSATDQRYTGELSLVSLDAKGNEKCRVYFDKKATYIRESISVSDIKVVPDNSDISVSKNVDNKDIVEITFTYDDGKLTMLDYGNLSVSGYILRGEKVVYINGKSYVYGVIYSGYKDEYNNNKTLQEIETLKKNADRIFYCDEISAEVENENGIILGIEKNDYKSYYTPVIAGYVSPNGELLSEEQMALIENTLDKKVSGQLNVVTLDGVRYKYTVYAVMEGENVVLKYHDGSVFVPANDIYAQLDNLENSGLGIGMNYDGYITVNGMKYVIKRVIVGGVYETRFGSSDLTEDALDLKNVSKNIVYKNITAVRLQGKNYYYSSQGNVYSDEKMKNSLSDMSVNETSGDAVLSGNRYKLNVASGTISLVQNLCSVCGKEVTIVSLGDNQYKVYCPNENCRMHKHTVTYNKTLKTYSCACANCQLYEDIKGSLIGKSGEVLFVTDINSTYPETLAYLSLFANHISYRQDEMQTRLIWNQEYADALKNIKNFVSAKYADEVDVTAQELYARTILMNWPTMTSGEQNEILTRAYSYQKERMSSRSTDNEIWQAVYSLLCINEKFDFTANPSWLTGGGNNTVAVTILLMMAGSNVLYTEKVLVKVIFGDYNPMGYYTAKSVLGVTQYEEATNIFSYEQANITTAMRGTAVPKGTYFENIGEGKYALTEDEVFAEKKTYYRLVTGDVYIAVRATYFNADSGLDSYQEEGISAPYDNIGETAYKLLQFYSATKVDKLGSRKVAGKDNIYLLRVTSVYWLFDEETETVKAESFKISADSDLYQSEQFYTIKTEVKTKIAEMNSLLTRDFR